MSISKVNISGTDHQIVGSPRYATCSTAAATAAKVATIADGSSTFSLEKGARICVSFTYANTASAATLNVASTGAKAICWQGSALVSSQYWQAGAVVDFVYDGNGWSIVGVAKDNNSTNFLPLSGGSLTGNLTVGSSSIGTNGYVEGTWLRTTKATESAGNFATISGDGWIYKRAPANVLGDIGGQAKITANGFLKGDGTGGITADKPIFYVTITGTVESPTADKTPAEIYQAYENGYAVYANVTLTGSSSSTNLKGLLPLAYVLAGTDAQYAITFSSISGKEIKEVRYSPAIRKWEVPYSGVIATKDDLSFTPESIGAQPKITAKGLLKGNGNGVVAAADETEVELVDLPIRAESIIIPKGRMRGDVDGDGKITQDDVNQTQKHNMEEITLTGADLWCADINGDGSVDSTDVTLIGQYLQGYSTLLTSTPTFADYYNNWTYHKVDDLTGYWTTEISIAGLTTSNNVVVNICETFLMGQFYKAEVSTGKVKIYATTPPITDIPAIVVISSGSGKGSIPSYLNESSVQPEVFWATYGQTTTAELTAAWDAGKLIKLKRGKIIYELGLRVGSEFFYFYSVTTNSNAGSVLRAKLTGDGNWAADVIGYICDRTASVSLPTASWTGSDPYTQTVTITDSTANTKVDIQPSEELYDQLVADNVGYLAIKNVDGTLTAIAKGGKPSVDLTVQVTYNNVY